MENKSKKKNYYIFLAIKEAFKSVCRCKHGCVVVNKNKIVGSGYNKALSYVNEELNIKKFKEVLERADIKKINRPVLKLYIDKYYSRSIAAFDGDEIISSLRNIKFFIKTIKFLIIDFVILKILLRKILKKIIRG